MTSSYDNPSNSLLMQFVISGDEAKFRKYLQRCDINQQNDQGDTALILCASHERKTFLNTLITMDNTNLDIKNKNGQTALFFAHFRKSGEMVKSLLYMGAKEFPDISKEVETYTQMMVGIINGDIELVRSRLGKDDINATNHRNETPIILAAYYNHEDILKLLLENGANVFAQDEDGRSAYSITSLRSRVSMKKLLNDYSETPLMKAVRSGQIDRVKECIGTCDINARNLKKKTALRIAVTKCSLDIVKLLVEAGANPLIVDKRSCTVPEYLYRVNKNDELIGYFRKWISVKELQLMNYGEYSDSFDEPF